VVTRISDVAFIKGHATQNDFVILPDFEGRLDVTAERVQWLCDRRRGIGADGVLRVVRCANDLEFASYSDVAEFFMDYRNADGSIAEMCGNGARLFVRYLHATGALSSRTTVVATRGGLIEAEVRGHEAEEIAIGMGAVTAEGSPIPITARLGERSWDAMSIHVPNPHAVAFVESLDTDVVSLDVPPLVTPAEAFPDGVNVEFVERVGAGHVRMRVYERGVGETRSCGTGACAAAWVAAITDPLDTCDSYRVDIPGGTVWVDIESDGRLTLRGPAELVARGTLQWPRGL
jgi:diaminopimelate epimerase